LSGLSFSLPWFIYDIDNGQLITSKNLPSDISDTKEVIITEIPVPGLNYQPMQPGGGGNRKISFTIPLIRKDGVTGNVALLKQFDRLRNQATGFLSWSKMQFNSNPKVLYSWGIGSVPLPYRVKKCDATHKQGWVNGMGMPQYSEIDIELWLDETSALYKAEEIYRVIASALGEVTPGALR